MTTARKVKVAREEKYFLPYQQAWIEDPSPLMLIEKSRQIGMSYATAFQAVRDTATTVNHLDTWVSSRDDTQAKLFLQDCKAWAEILKIGAQDLGEVVVDKDTSAYALEFANGKRIYSLSSNPNALAGKCGNVILDEFALHSDQRLLYRIAKPVTTWGGRLKIISTHRGAATVFNEIVKSVKEGGNPMGWSLHTVPLATAVDQGLVEKINAKTGRAETREAYLARIRAECLDEEQWQQEYCCVPCDDATAFLPYELITQAETDCLKDWDYLEHCPNDLYLGNDVGRKRDLTVMSIGEKMGDVLWLRMRIELSKTKFAEQRETLYRVFDLPKLRRGNLDASGLGMQLAEEARQKYGYKVEEVTFTGPVKESLAYPLRALFEDRKIRIDSSPALRADLRGVKKETTAAGNIRFAGDTDDSHCDRFWSLALMVSAAASKQQPGSFRIFNNPRTTHARAIIARERENRMAIAA